MKNPVSILMYHQVGRFTKIPPGHHASLCLESRFTAQLALLRILGYKIISLAEACDGIFDGASLPPRSAVLTFDDGYQNFADVAWPILRRHGLPATVYLVSAHMGQRAHWLGDDFDAATLMDAATVRRLASDKTLAFGSHTRTHPRLTRLSASEKRKEIFESKAELEALLQTPIRDFCYPFGDYDEAARDMAREAGYATAVSCVRGAANTSVNRHELTRKAVSYGDNLVGFFWKLVMKNRRKDISRYSPAHVLERGRRGESTTPPFGHPSTGGEFKNGRHPSAGGE